MHASQQGRTVPPARRRSPKLALLFISIVLAGCARTQAVFQKGFTFSAWEVEEYRSDSVAQQLGELRKGGVDWIALTPRWLQDSKDSTEIYKHPRLSPSDESIRHVIRLAHRSGLQVLLKPQLDLMDGGWRGEITFSEPDEWEPWFENYGRFIHHYADIAEAEGVAIFCVGVELDGTVHRETAWRKIIRSVRERFSGALTYAANWGREEDIRWWDSLDYAGLDAYFPLSAKPGSEVPDLKQAWAVHVGHLRSWASRVGKPVLLTEIGYRSVEYAAAEPWEWKRGGRVSLQEQSRLYQAALEVLWDESWLYGMYWWEWRPFRPVRVESDIGFTPQDKPAWEILRSFYGQERSPR